MAAPCHPQCHCSSSQASRVAKAFSQAGGLHAASRCPNTALWMQAVTGPLSRLSGDVLVVGCNKGDSAIGFLRMLTGSSRYGDKAWHDALVRNCHLEGRCPRDSDYKEGGWNVCPEVMALPMWQGGLERPRTQVLCVEGLLATATVLNASARALGWPMEVVYAAVTSTTNPSTLMFPNSLNFGTENLGLSGQGQNWALWKKANRARNASGSKGTKYPVVNVPAQTVDVLVERRRRPVEVLLIDVEGHDPNVLKGATRTLASGTVGYIEFEVSWGGVWKYTSVNSTVHNLDRYGYDCFWAGTKTLYPITGCYHRAYDNVGLAYGIVWGNIACAHRDHHQWHHALWKVARVGFPEVHFRGSAGAGGGNRSAHREGEGAKIRR